MWKDRPSYPKYKNIVRTIRLTNNLNGDNVLIKIETEIEKLEDSNLPNIKILNLKGLNIPAKIKLEYHNALGLSFKEGEKAVLTIFNKNSKKEEKIDDGIYCGNLVLYSIKEKNGSKIALFSIGGLILRIEISEKAWKTVSKELEVPGEYYFCLKTWFWTFL